MLLETERQKENNTNRQKYEKQKDEMTEKFEKKSLKDSIKRSPPGTVVVSNYIEVDAIINPG